MRPRLRLFIGDDDNSTTVAEPHVSVRLHEILTALKDAVLLNRSWLTDFEDDEIQIPSDLYDVISAYNHLRPSA